MSVLHTNNITNRDGTSGPTIAGITTVSSTGYMKVPTGDTRTRLVKDVENIVTDGLVLHLDAGRAESFGGDGTTWRDLSGNGNNGTLQGGVGFTVDDGGSLIFDGVNDYVDCGFAASVRSSSVSHEVWIKFSISQSMKSLISLHKDGTGGCSIGIHDDYPNRIKFHTNTIGANGGNGILGTNSLNDNIWHHVVGTYDNSSSTMRLYIDGVLDITLVGPTTPIYPSDRNLNVGRWPGGGTQYFNGNISNAKIYNRALTAAEVLQNYNATKGRYS